MGATSCRRCRILSFYKYKKLKVDLSFEYETRSSTSMVKLDDDEYEEVLEGDEDNSEIMFSVQTSSHQLLCSICKFSLVVKKLA